jgi:hypothetical protein
MNLAILLRPHSFLLSRVAAIERGEIEVRGRLGPAKVVMIRPKKVVDNDGSEVEQHAGDLVRVFLSVTVGSSHETVKDVSSIG